MVVQAELVKRVETWRWGVLAVAAITLLGGIVTLSLGGPSWPATVGAVATWTLGEIWREKLRKLKR